MAQASGSAMVIIRRTAIAALLLALFAVPLLAQNDVSNEYRFTANPFHPIKGNLIGFGYLGLVTNPDKGVKSYYLGWPGVSYKPMRWMECWSGLIYIWNDNENSENTFEFRPFVGLKTYIPNGQKINLYNFTRYEYRSITKKESDTNDAFSRIRSRFGAEFPLSADAWQPKTYYGLGDIEPYYRFDKDTVDLLRVRAGLGYVVNERLRVEFIYHIQLSRSDPSDPLRYNSNIFRVNFKIATTKGILSRLSPQRWSDVDVDSD